MNICLYYKDPRFYGINHIDRNLYVYIYIYIYAMYRNAFIPLLMNSNSSELNDDLDKIDNQIPRNRDYTE